MKNSDEIINGSNLTETAQMDLPSPEAADSDQRTVAGSHEGDTPRIALNNNAPDKTLVHTAPNLLHMVTGLVTTAEQQRDIKGQRNLNELVHRMLLVGLVISTALMLFGLALDLVQGREVPTTALGFADTLRQVADLHPSGFITLGILVLIATPILRVIGSIAAFVYERDWRYALITFAVLMVVLISLVSGNG